MSLVYRVLGVGATLIVLAGCGGGGNHAAALPPSGGGPQSTARVPVSFKVIIPPKSTSSASATRTPKYISPSTQSISIGVNGNTPVAQNITTGGPNCNTPTVISPTTCTVTVNAPPGTPDTFVITTYDQPNSGGPPFAGNILSQSSFNQNIIAGQANVVNVSLGGYPSSMTVSPLSDSPYLVGSTASGFTSYFTEAHHIAVVTYDADNNPIVGTGAPALGVVGTAGLTVTAPAAGASQNVFTVQNAAFNTSETLTVTATPAAGSGASVLTQVIPVNTKHIVVSIAARGVTTGTLNVYDDNTAAAVRTIALSDNPTGFFTDNLGDSVIPMQGSTVQVFSGGATTPTYTLSNGVSTPRSGCSDHEGNLYITNGGSTVIEFPSGGGGNTASALYSAAMSTPVDCVIDVDDSLWVLNNGDASLTHFPAGSTTNDLHFTLSGGIAAAQAFSLGIDRFGNLYVGYGTGTHAAVQVYPKGSQTAAFEVATTANDDPSGTVVDIGGSLWVGNFLAGTTERFAAPVTASSTGNAVSFTAPGTNIKLDVTPKALPTTP